MPHFFTHGPDEIIRVYREQKTHTFKGEPLVGAPFDVLFVTFYGARSIEISIPKNAVLRDGTPTCVPGLIMLRDELNKIIDEYSNVCPTCKRKP